MRPSRLQLALQAGETLSGLFTPVGADFATPGVLSWSSETGGQVQLADLDDPWPTDFNAIFTLHARLHAHPEPVTLMNCRVTQKLMLDTPARIASQTLALGSHTDVDERWPVANYAASSTGPCTSS